MWPAPSRPYAIFVSVARIWTALRTSLLKSSRIRWVAICPIAPPKRRRINRVRPAETEARRQRTGQERGRRKRRPKRPSPFAAPPIALSLEDVAGTAFGVQQARLAARLELAPQVGDEDVDRVRRRHRVIAPDLVEQALAGDDEALVAHQELEQLELAVGQLDLALAAAHLAGVRVEDEVADFQRGGAPRGAAAQQGPDPRQQLLALEGLRQVVVGAAVEAGHPVLGLGAGGQHQDRHVAVAAQAAADLDSVEARQPEVEHDQVGHEPGGDVEGLDPVGRGADFVALVAERAAEDVGDVDVVLDDEDAASHLVDFREHKAMVATKIAAPREFYREFSSQGWGARRRTGDHVRA